MISRGLDLDFVAGSVAEVSKVQRSGSRFKELTMFQRFNAFKWSNSPSGFLRF